MSYTGPIIDAHHHLWDLSMGRHPWLASDGEVSGALPGLDRIARDFGVAEYRAGAAGQDIAATVHVEALWSGDPVEETRWLETLDKDGGIACRYVGAAPLGANAAPAIISEQASFDRMTGIRAVLSWHPDPSKCFVGDPELGRSPAWRRDVAHLDRLGLNLELMTYPYQAEIALEVARLHPGLTIVINHCGSPIDRDEPGMRHWRQALATLASAPNIMIKISDPCAYDHHWTRASIAEVALQCIEAFGPERAMFASDMPVSGIWMTFDQMFSVYREVARPFSRHEQWMLFAGTASRVYGIPTTDVHVVPELPNSASL
jgi:predicted TIM-barrel fold metal-dependent hydrolase